MLSQAPTSDRIFLSVTHMQSELRIGNSRAKALSNIAAKAQQRHQASNQSTASRTDSRSFAKPSKAAMHRPPVLRNYTYNARYPQRRVDYIWASAEWNAQCPGSNLQALRRLAHSPWVIVCLNCTRLIKNVYRVLGFDMEWRPTFVKGQPVNPVALIQLAGENDIALVHVHFLSMLKIIASCNH
jgi:hypothetical protein